MPEQTYMIHSTVRKVETRLLRAVAPQHHKLVQRLAGGDILVRRARPTAVTESKLLKNLAELRQAEKEGRIRVTTNTGRPVDLDSLAPKPVVAVSKPLPNPPLDSAANDRTYGSGVGVVMPQHARGDTAFSTTGLPKTLEVLSKDSDEAPVPAGGDPALARKKLEESRVEEEEPESDEEAEEDEEF